MAGLISSRLDDHTKNHLPTDRSLVLALHPPCPMTAGDLPQISTVSNLVATTNAKAADSCRLLRKAHIDPDRRSVIGTERMKSRRYTLRRAITCAGPVRSEQLASWLSRTSLDCRRRASKFPTHETLSWNRLQHFDLARGRLSGIGIASCPPGRLYRHDNPTLLIRKKRSRPPGRTMRGNTMTACPSLPTLPTNRACLLKVARWTRTRNSG